MDEMNPKNNHTSIFSHNIVEIIYLVLLPLRSQFSSELDLFDFVWELSHWVV
jgi:hypothetical protein